MESEGTSAIVKVLPQERAQRQWMTVVHQNFWGVHDPVAVSQPSMTELSVFPRSTVPGSVKSTCGMKVLGRQSQIVGC
jgi:hypothetical protein